MTYSWTLSVKDRELLKLLASKLAGAPHPSFFEAHGFGAKHQPAVVTAFISNHPATFSGSKDDAAVDITESEREELINELEALGKRLEHESDDLVLVPTSTNPSADFWDIFAHTHELANSLTVLKPQNEQSQSPTSHS